MLYRLAHMGVVVPLTCSMQCPCAHLRVPPMYCAIHASLSTLHSTLYICICCEPIMSEINQSWWTCHVSMYVCTDVWQHACAHLQCLALTHAHMHTLCTCITSWRSRVRSGLYTHHAHTSWINNSSNEVTTDWLEYHTHTQAWYDI